MEINGFKGIIDSKIKENIESINNDIKREKMNGENADMHRIYRLEEQKLIQGLFNGIAPKYRSPW